MKYFKYLNFQYCFVFRASDFGFLRGCDLRLGSPSPGFPDFRITCLAIFICLTTFGFSYQSAVWQKVGSGIYEPVVLKLAIHPHDPSLIFAATNKALYQSSDGGRHYQSVFQASGEFQGINDIYIDPHQLPTFVRQKRTQSGSRPNDSERRDTDNIYIATDAGLYFSSDAGEHWQRTYYSSNEQSRKCLALLRAGETLYLGTGNGLFYRSVDETSWSAVGNELSRKAVNHIVAGEHFIYFATDDAVYDLDRKTSSYSRIFTAGSAQTIVDNESDSVTEEEVTQSLVRFIRVASDDDTTIYIATARGIYLSGDGGQHWRLLANPPVDLETLNAFVLLGEGEERKLLVGTKRGAFLFDNGRWTPVYQGMETNAMNDLVKDARGRVYAATDRGVFYLSSEQALPLFPSEDHSRNEPTIQQVHRWAIDYAEVSPDKIKNWRSLAGKRALLPDFSVGLDRAEGELYHWDTGPNPDNLLKGRDLLNWDVSLSWDLGDLIWSTDQTTIDSRSKLMVELREDVLDQVTRLYFERRRLQVDLAADALEPAVEFDKQLRVEELTALLDAFTGGKFSQEIARGHKVTTSQSYQSSDVSRQSSDLGYQGEIWKNRSSRN